MLVFSRRTPKSTKKVTFTNFCFGPFFWFGVSGRLLIKRNQKNDSRAGLGRFESLSWGGSLLSLLSQGHYFSILGLWLSEFSTSFGAQVAKVVRPKEFGKNVTEKSDRIVGKRDQEVTKNQSPSKWAGKLVPHQSSVKTSKIVFETQKTREGCGCFWDLFGGSLGKLQENSGKNAVNFSLKREML